jgi:hypothetical protein
MAYYPISLLPPQWHVDGVPASGYVLKAYQDNTSTLLQMATDNTGLTLVNTMTLNSQGYPSVSGNIVIPHVDQAYKIALYPTQAAADGNSGAVWNPDNLVPYNISSNISISGNTIESTNANGDITLDPNGTGEINLNGPVSASDFTLNGIDLTNSVLNHKSFIRTFLQTDGSAAAAFDMDANITEGAFESVGPTSSGATNIYTGMDGITSGATFAIFWVTSSGTSDSTSQVSLQIFARPTGSSITTGFGTMVANLVSDPDAAGEVFSFGELIYAPLDSSKRTDITWSNSSSSADTVAIYYRGYCI